jgi:hypothetical protein
MPVTAVLSRTLHATLGDEAAADLVDWMQQVDTHRADLRELNELSFARIESRFNEHDARFGEARCEMLTEVANLRLEMRDGFAELKVAIARTDAKIDSRFADLLKWSFLFWCGTFAAAILARWPR